MGFTWSSLGILFFTFISALSHATPIHLHTSNYPHSNQLISPKHLRIVPSNLSKNDFHILYGLSASNKPRSLIKSKQTLA